MGYSPEKRSFSILSFDTIQVWLDFIRTEHHSLGKSAPISWIFSR